jgi:hypothetical protein
VDGFGGAWGTRVLDELVAGMNRFLEARPPVGKRSDSTHGLLACAMWVDDDQFIDTATRFGNACMVVKTRAWW